MAALTARDAHGPLGLCDVVNGQRVGSFLAPISRAKWAYGLDFSVLNFACFFVHQHFGVHFSREVGHLPVDVALPSANHLQAIFLTGPIDHVGLKPRATSCRGGFSLFNVIADLVEPGLSGAAPRTDADD